MTTQPAGTASADLCGCTRYKPHWVHGDPWCHCGHPRWDHAEGDDACNSRHTQPAGEHHTGTLNLTGEGNQPHDSLAALDDEIATTYGAIHVPGNLAEILARHGWARASETRQQVAEEITAALAARRSEITPGRPGWGYLTEAIDITNRVGGAA